MMPIFLFLRRTTAMICCITVAASGIPNTAISAGIEVKESELMHHPLILDEFKLTQLVLPRQNIELLRRENQILRTGPLTPIGPPNFRSVQDRHRQEIARHVQEILSELTTEEQQGLRCRLARLGEARVEVLLSTLLAMSATEAEAASAREHQSALTRAVCSGSDDVLSPMQAQSQLFDSVARRFSSGTIFEDQGPMLGVQMYMEALRQLDAACLGESGGFSFDSIAKMNEGDFEASLPVLSLGTCSARTASGAARLAGFMSKSSSTVYGQCVAEAMRDSVTKSVQECGIDQDEPEDSGEGADTPTPTPTEPATGSGNPAADQRDQNRGSVGILVGVIEIVGGLIVAGTGAASIAGTIGGGSLVGVPVMGMGLGMMKDGLDRAFAGSRTRDDALRAQGRLCPALETPMGPLSFTVGVNLPRGGTQKAPMAVFDVMRSCACENSVNLNIPGQGNTCENAERRRCLSQANDDVPTPDLSCRALLKKDNQELLSAKYRECSVVNCGPAAMIGEDCGCHQEAAAGPEVRARERLGIGAACQIQCMPGYRPSGAACSCVPEGEGPDGQNPRGRVIQGPQININPGPIDRGGRFGAPGRIRPLNEINRPGQNSPLVRPPD